MQLLSDETIKTLFDKLPDKEKPQKLYARGLPQLLQKRKIAIVGARRASKYAKTQTYLLANKLSSCGFAVVSGAAEGIDASAHEGAGQNTIAVMPCGLDICYPQANKNLIEKIHKDSLALSEYEEGEMPRNYTFVHRNRLVVGMSEAVVVTEADEKSGSMRSAEYALKYDIPLFVLAHRIDESIGTNRLLKEGIAKPIFDIDSFIRSVGGNISSQDDEAMIFAASSPSAAEFFERFGERMYELELYGQISVKNGRVLVL